MRIWSIHPKYLDNNALIGLWNEVLQAKKELQSKKSDYSNPQLERFLELKNPMDALNNYLSLVYKEVVKRNINVDPMKVDWDFDEFLQIPVTAGQITHEISELKSRLREEDQEKLNSVNSRTFLELHPIFYSVPGAIESWDIAV